MNKEKKDSISIISSGKKVIDHAASSLQLLSKGLADCFVKAVEILYCPANRVIVSGMGKSGHVAKKIAATLSSTGQPSFFVHPAEASHGDLGMISKNDRLLLISNGGETPELKSIINYAKRFSIPIVGITSNAKSTLAEVSTVVLCLPCVGEACPMGLAPTTSTTLTMALGDALAVALLEYTGFTRKDFYQFHPGGILGKQLSGVDQYMHKAPKIPLVHRDVSMAEAIIRITSYGFGSIGIVDHEEKLIGMITDGDLRRHMAPDLLKKTVFEIMNDDPVKIDDDCLMAQGLSLMEEKKITGLFVTKKKTNIPVGFLHIHDCLRLGIT